MDDLSGLEKLQPNMLLNLVFGKIDENFERKTAVAKGARLELNMA
jgi:hypothetical protein